MKIIRGTIVVAQERRFQLSLESGGRKIFLLKADVPLQDRDLQRLASEQVSVQVRYEDSPGRIAAVAHALLMSGATARADAKKRKGSIR